MDGMAASLARSPELFPHSYDVRRETVSLVRLNRADYETASFLDERALGPHTLARTLPFAQLAAGVEEAGLEEHCDFIFHMGHVGSTLLSRLLGAHESIFSLREPLVLRALAQMERDDNFELRLSTFLKLLSRTFEAGQTALVKTTSFVSELAPLLLARPAAPKAILLYVKPETYIATILAGPNARAEAKRLLPSRLDRLHRRIGREVWEPASLAEGEALALAWATEMSVLVQAKAAGGERVFVLDFDKFLESPAALLLATFRFLGSNVDEERVSAILSGPLMERYSKAPEHAFNPQMRRELLDEARELHGDEIANGLAWLDRAAHEVPPIAECVTGVPKISWTRSLGGQHKPKG